MLMLQGYSGSQHPSTCTNHRLKLRGWELSVLVPIVRWDLLDVNNLLVGQPSGDMGLAVPVYPAVMWSC